MNSEKIPHHSNSSGLKSILNTYWNTYADQISFSLILISGFIIFSGIFSNELLLNWDDQAYIIHNDLLRALSVEKIKIIFSSFFIDNYHPLTTVSNAIEYYFLELNPVIYHLNNLLLHCCNAFLVYVLFKNLKVTKIASLTGAVVFLIHPMHVESVVWASERKDVLYAFFYFLSLIFYTKYNEKKDAKNSYVYSLICFLLSLLSKPSAVSLPLMLLLFDYYQNKGFNRRSITEKIPFFILSLIFGIITLFAQQEAMQVSPVFTVTDRIFLVSYSLMFYLIKFFAPFHLSAFHPYPVKDNGWLPLIFYASAIALSAICISLFFIRKSSRKEVLFGVLFFFVSILLMLQIVPVGRTIVSERFSYIPYTGLIFIVLKMYDHVGIKFRKVYLLLIPVYIPLMTGLTSQRTAVWKDGSYLFADVVKKYPESSYAWSTRAYHYFVLNDVANAETYYKKAFELNSSDDDIPVKLGKIAEYRKDSVQAVIQYKLALQINPANAFAWNNIGLIYTNEKKYSEALKCFNNAIQYNPEFTDAFANRAVVKTLMNDYRGALSDYEKVKITDNKNAELYKRTGMLKSALGNDKEAISDLDRAIELAPDIADFYTERGIIKLKKNELKDAENDFSTSIVMRKNNPAAYYRRAVARNLMNRKAEACSDLGTAASLGNTDARNLYQKFCSEKK